MRPGLSNPGKGERVQAGAVALVDASMRPGLSSPGKEDMQGYKSATTYALQ